MSANSCPFVSWMYHNSNMFVDSVLHYKILYTMILQLCNLVLNGNCSQNLDISSIFGQLLDPYIYVVLVTIQKWITF